MTLPTIRDRALNLVNEAWQEGFSRGLLEAASRLRLIASVVPHTVSKGRLIEMAGREAEVLEKKAKGKP